jgi:hypothetical protein
MNFEEWMRKVNAELDELCGLSADDIADADYRSMYDSGVLPRVAAFSALCEAGWTGEGE